ncbi:MAG: MBL fold metallo-hydrolase, partial [Kangiellaceae bacterium]|nr:MBL fold metallo-hydrolase [Kangiellaceae bacterium]
MIFRQLYDATSYTYTYLLADEESKEAVYIDTVYEQTNRDLALLDELGLKLTAVIDTHVHADHVTGAWNMKQKTGAQIAIAKAANTEYADLQLVEGDKIQFGNYHLDVLATPGHTDGCLTFVTNDKSKAFTGDALLIRGCGRVDFQQGDAATLFSSIVDKVFTLPESCMIYPGHDYQGRTVSSVEEEKSFNARLGGGANLTDFKGYMDAMQLPHPNQIDVAVPGNKKNGMPQ